MKLLYTVFFAICGLASLGFSAPGDTLSLYQQTFDGAVPSSFVSYSNGHDFSRIGYASDTYLDACPDQKTGYNNGTKFWMLQSTSGTFRHSGAVLSKDTVLLRFSLASCGQYVTFESQDQFIASIAFDGDTAKTYTPIFRAYGRAGATPTVAGDPLLVEGLNQAIIKAPVTNLRSQFDVFEVKVPRVKATSVVSIKLAAITDEGGEEIAVDNVQIMEFGRNWVAPVAKNVAIIEVLEDSPSISVNLENYFTDVSDPTPRYTFEVSAATGSEIVDYTFSGGSQLALLPKANRNGTATFTIKATDRDGLVSTNTATLTINPVSDPTQIVSAIPDQDLAEDFAVLNISLDGRYSDVDGGALQYSIRGANLVTAQLEMLPSPVLILNAISNIYGTDTLVVEVSDGSGPSALDSVIIQVQPAVDPTILTLPSRIQLQEDASAQNVSLTGLASDADQLPISYRVDLDKCLNFIRLDLVGDQLQVTPIANAFGTCAFSLYAGDGFGQEASGEVDVTITNVSDPTVAPVPNPRVQVLEDQGIDTVLLSAYFSDPDKLPLRYSVGDSHGIVQRQNGDSLFLKTAPDFYGNLDLSVVAEDGDGLSASILFTISVENVPDSTKSSQGTQTLELDEDFVEKEVLRLYFSDADAMPLNYVVKTKGIVEANWVSQQLEIQSIPDRFGVDTVLIQVGDGIGADVVDTVIVTIHAKPDPTLVFLSLPDMNLREDFSDASISLLDHIRDADSEDLTYTTRASSGIKVLMSGSMLKISSLANVFGRDTVFLEVSDHGDTPLLDTFVVNVAAVNDAPKRVQKIGALTEMDTFKSLRVSLDGRFEDIDNTSLLYEISGANVIKAFIRNDSLIITPATGIHSGKDTLYVKALDSEDLFAMDTVIFTLRALNSAPVVPSQSLSVLAALTVDKKVTLSLQASDPDGDELEYFVEGPSWVTVSGNKVTAFPSTKAANSSGTIHLYVTDGQDTVSIGSVNYKVSSTTAILASIKASPLRIRAVQGGIVVQGMRASDEVQIMKLDGTRLQTNPDASGFVALVPGLYWIQNAGAWERVMVP